MVDYQIQEFADLTAAVIEASDGGDLVIRSAVILGPVSENGGPGYTSRFYTPGAMREAVPLYEGARGYFNHATWEDEDLRAGNRDVRDFAGAWSAVRFDEATNKLVGDFHIVDGADGRQLANVAKRFPKNSFGFSHDALVSAEVDEDTETLRVTHIRAVNSVDVVDRPATTRNFFEHARKPTSEKDDEMTETKEAIEARVIAEAARKTELAEAKAESKLLKTENEALKTELAEGKKAVGVSETQVAVERLVADVSDPIAKRVRAMFKGKVATEASVEKAIKALEDFTEEVGGKSVTEAPGGRRTDGNHRETDGVDEDTDQLAEDVFGELCGTNISEKKPAEKVA